MNWLDILRAEVEATSKTKVAETLGVSRTAISLLCGGKYRGKTDKMAARVLLHFGKGRVLCPHLAAEITVPACAEYRARLQPTSSAEKVKHWRACQTCVVGEALEQGADPAPVVAAPEPANDSLPPRKVLHAAE